ncbi:MAG: glycosyltransferase [Burkholderiaceae bacterium]
MTHASGSAVSVVICTHNRAADAQRCVAAAAPQVAAQGWELLVVDSASSSEHAQALAALPAAHPGLVLSRLEQPGLSAARNRGAELAQGDWVAYLDDDAIVQPGWAERLDAALRALPPAVAMVGGRIEALWPDGASGAEVTPRWLLMLSCVDAPVGGRVADGHNICGANFAIRRGALAAIGGFPTALGRVGGRLISGEESFVIRRLQQSGLDSVYDPSFGVLHCIEPQRLTRRWIAQRAYWEGVTRVVMHRALREPFPATIAPLKLLATLPLLWGLRWLRPANPDHLIRMNLACGSLHARLKGASE